MLGRFKSRRPLIDGADQQSSDKIYARGGWDDLADAPQLGRYSIIAGYCAHLGAKAVLDVGCGEGLLAQRLSRPPLEAYYGVDISQLAIQRAREAGIANARFEVGEARTYAPDRRFDVIVFNEMLYYLDDPKGVVAAHCAFLEPGGAFVVSIHKSPRHQWVWRDLAAVSDVTDAVAVQHGSGNTWDVRLVRPKSAA